MGQEKVVDSYLASELEVSGLDSDIYCKLPKISVQHKMPVNISNIPRQQDLEKWPHLKHIYLPEIDADVEILIGMNVPRALEPLEVVRSMGGGPYAVKTMLGWTANGPIGDCSDSPGYSSVVTINRISAITLDELWNQQFKTDFPENSQNEVPGMSRESARHRFGAQRYIPQHGIYHPQKGKFGVVFDCGASFKGSSLNAHLLQGPDLTSTLIGVFIRFRKEPIVPMSDIEAMFHQVLMPLEDADLLRFLWWPDGDFSQCMEEYRMVSISLGLHFPQAVLTLLFGYAEDNKELFSQQVFETIMHSFYVDDLLVSVASEQEAISMYRDLRVICAKGGFHLTKWISNRLRIWIWTTTSYQWMGVRWCVQSDTFRFSIIFQDRTLTRRGILSTVSSFYDPLGILALVVFTAKRILQGLYGQIVEKGAEDAATRLCFLVR
ncbi:hypothetical protein L3Q82_021067 [Scortum barcoo]|uniref:Uncharacterized protein n=1 Tax=Scortum barcoo TaxID=214431 RepID=A0ACB8X522_9TELE|nr:hypothetical protein L3Q82_021067 [Scortum barcoo]